MPWYKTGTVNVTLNSNAVIGTGTAFIANSRVGDAFRGPDGGWYEITNIASDTAMAIDPPYQGATNASGAYALAPMQGYVKDSADALRALVNQFGGVLAVLGEDPTLAGVRTALNLTNADGMPQGETNKYLTNSGVIGSVLTGLDPGASGSVVATDSVITAFSKLKNSKASSGSNADITELNALAKALTPAQGGVSAGYIEGLVPVWNSQSSITLQTGSAWIPGLSKSVTVATDLTLSSLSLTANTWYYLYLFESGGTAAIELVSTAPSAPYSGTARVKTGDDSRRFVGAFRSNTGTGLWRFVLDSTGIVNYEESVSAAPFLVVNSGASTTPATAVACSAVVPPTTKTVKILLINAGTPVVFMYASGNTSATIVSASASTRMFVTLLTSGAAQNIYYANANTGGVVFIDVCGYGNDR